MCDPFLLNGDEWLLNECKKNEVWLKNWILVGCVNNACELRVKLERVYRRVKHEDVGRRGRPSTDDTGWPQAL